LKQKTDKAGAAPRAFAFHWQTALVTVLVSALAIGLVAAQFSYAQNPQSPQSQISLSDLSQRATFLGQITNLIERDKYCVPLSALGRNLDAAIAPDAKVFMTGMLGPTNSGAAGYYYFLRNYLFPRHVQISLDGHATYNADGFNGIPCDSPDILRSNGYDVMILFSDGQLQNVIPLTPKAARHPNE
jgi:hypothetical protein